MEFFPNQHLFLFLGAMSTYFFPGLLISAFSKTPDEGLFDKKAFRLFEWDIRRLPLPLLFLIGFSRYLQGGVSIIEALATFFFLSSFYLLAIIDMKHQAVPDNINLINFILGVLIVPLSSMNLSSLTFSVVSAVFVMAIFWGLGKLMAKGKGEAVMGGADIPVLGAMAGFLPNAFPLAVTSSAFFALIAMVFLRKEKMAFIPFLFAGTLFAFLYPDFINDLLVYIGG